MKISQKLVFIVLIMIVALDILECQGWRFMKKRPKFRHKEKHYKNKGKQGMGQSQVVEKDKEVSSSEESSSSSGEEPENVIDTTTQKLSSKQLLEHATTKRNDKPIPNSKTEPPKAKPKKQKTDATTTEGIEMFEVVVEFPGGEKIEFEVPAEKIETMEEGKLDNNDTKDAQQQVESNAAGKEENQVNEQNSSDTTTGAAAWFDWG